MSDISDLVAAKLPYKIRQYIVFLDEWDPHPNFYHMTIRERLLYQTKFMTKQVEPTMNNLWIWFGAYASKDKYPVFYNSRVIRPIYEALIGPLTDPKTNKNRRLINSLVEHVADVNPFKYLEACGKRYMGVSRHAHLMNLELDYRKLAKEQYQTQEERIINSGMLKLHENLESFNTEEGWHFVLNSFGVPETVSTIIINKFKEKYHDDIERYRNTSGTAQPTENREIALDAGFGQNSEPASNTPEEETEENNPHSEIVGKDVSG